MTSVADNAPLDEGAGGASPTDTGREDTFFLPTDFPNSDSLKAGDTVTLTVVGKDADGNVEVEHQPDQGEGEPPATGWKSDLSAMKG